MLDLLIRGGTLVDGSGAPGRAADVGVRDGRIAALGRVEESAARTLDAAGLVVAPGFVDIHTHYDAQVFWDPTLSPSSYHGVTTIVGGNCGFSIAPLSDDAADYLLRMLARVEGMPLESLRVGVPWDWRSFGDYLDRLEGRVAVNAGFLVGHSALRRVVMGERAVGHEAGEAELSELRALLRESLAAGGLGFSSSRAVTHHDGDGRPVPSRHAAREELVMLARAVRDFPGTTLELLPAVGVFGEDERALMTELSLAANRPLNWNVLAPRSDAREETEVQLAASDYAAARGARVVALTVPQPVKARLNLVSGFALDTMPGWAPLFGLPLEERKRAFRDPATRERLRAGARSDEVPEAFRFMASLSPLTIDETFLPEHTALQGRSLGDVAVERGIEPLDVMLDLALAEDLRTSFGIELPGQQDPASWELRASVWRDPRAVIGASDAGAHLDMLDTFAFTTQVLGAGVRERGLLPLEEAVRLLSDAPARLYGLRERGRIELSWHADLVVFDPQRVGPGPTVTRFDLPGGHPRLTADALGIEHVLVNGVEIARAGRSTGALPGTVLRSGRHTDTVEVPGGAR